jgi:RHS repeat-associated protein
MDNHDYMPFGEEPIALATPNLLKFNGKERDAETGLDYFGARYYARAQGRFTSADAPFADQNPDNPQNWNPYSYARNNPLRNIDSDGRAAWLAGVLVGAGLDIAVQMAVEGKSFKELDWGSIGARLEYQRQLVE